PRWLLGRVRPGSAGLAVRLVAAAARAVLRQLQAVRGVPPVLLGDVVPLLALHARERDLGADVCALAGHVLSPLAPRGDAVAPHAADRRADLDVVAGAGLEPATPRL